jgi:ribosomal protein S21
MIPMTEKEYFAKSKKQRLPLRCPIIGKCERYALTVLYLSELNIHGKGRTLEDKLRSWGYLADNYEKEKIHQVGEPFVFSKSQNTCSISKACPEVSLFNNDMIFGFFPKKAITEGYWDNFWRDDRFEEDGKFDVEKTGHYSECSEFSQYHYENKIGDRKRQTAQRRNKISKKARFEIFQRDNFTCQYCKRNKDEDGVKLQLDHIIPVSEGGTDSINNLTTSCEDCNQGKTNKII